MSAVFLAAFVALAASIQLVLLLQVANKIPKPVLVLAGAAVSVLVYQVVAYIDLGFLDPFFSIAAAIQFAIAVGVGAAIVGILRSRRPPQRPG